MSTISSSYSEKPISGSEPVKLAAAAAETKVGDAKSKPDIIEAIMLLIEMSKTIQKLTSSETKYLQKITEMIEEDQKRRASVPVLGENDVKGLDRDANIKMQQLNALNSTVATLTQKIEAEMEVHQNVAKREQSKLNALQESTNAINDLQKNLLQTLNSIMQKLLSR